MRSGAGRPAPLSMRVGKASARTFVPVAAEIRLAATSAGSRSARPPSRIAVSPRPRRALATVVDRPRSKPPADWRAGAAAPARRRPTMTRRPAGSAWRPGPEDPAPPRSPPRRRRAGPPCSATCAPSPTRCAPPSRCRTAAARRTACGRSRGRPRCSRSGPCPCARCAGSQARCPGPAPRCSSVAAGRSAMRA